MQGGLISQRRYMNWRAWRPFGSGWVVAAAEKAYEADPEKSRDVPRFLTSLIIERLSKYQFDEVLRLVRLLQDHGEKDPKLSLEAGVAAFVLADYDMAAEQLKAADKANL